MRTAEKPLQAGEKIPALFLNKTPPPLVSWRSTKRKISFEIDRLLVKKAYGYRNTQRFINDIYFHCGGLDLYPAQ